ncbi:helix-turn-helix transcriptional regulator [Listeria costaricensis]|uniref:helix-turn-helix transcriptional regulator n=1 Tax=Listeria costaricensis TaxID=2026604 RepID=UPI000C080416|nr:helix-turn-helix transcriptional regulator [Listeria costaricensis]
MVPIQLSERQHQIIAFVKAHEPATGDQIAKHLKLTRATIRADLAVLTMTGILDARPKVGYFFSGLDENPALFEEIRQMKAQDVMTLPTLIQKETSVYDAIVTLFLEDIGSLYVVENATLIGLVSRKDLLKSAIAGTDTKQTPVATIMTRMPNLIVVEANESVLPTAELLVTHQIDSVPVVKKGDGSLEPIGKISKSTITRLFVDTWTRT